MGEDQPNTQLIHGSFKLGGLVIAVESMKPTMARGDRMGGSIQVDRFRKTGGEHLSALAYTEAAIEVFLALEESIEGFSCGIVGAQNQRGGLGAEPLMGRAIEQKHLSLLS